MSGVRHDLWFALRRVRMRPLHSAVVAPTRFLRIHRSAIMNLTRVRAVEWHLRDDGIVVLATGARLKVTQARREELERRLESLPDTT